MDANVGDTGRDAGRDGGSFDGGIDGGTDASDAARDVGRDAPIILPDIGMPCVSDVQCDDGVFCDGAERCVMGSCFAGTAVVCASDACNIGACSDTMRRCITVPVDRDGDGHTPRGCGGDDCDDNNALVSPSALERCTGGIDEDCDGLADCMDPDCRADPSCAMPTCPDRVLGSALGVIATGTTAGAGADSQGSCGASDGAPDLAFQWTAPSTGTYSFDTRTSSYDTVLYARMGCLGPQLGCDDDGGGGTTSLIRFPLTAGETIILFVDGFGMSSGNFVLHATLESSAENCTNGIDDDHDGLIDCADPDCAGAPTCCVPHTEICTNGVDDDCDRAVDCVDPDCASFPICCIPTTENCSNGVDDDCDGQVDCGDANCTLTPTCCMPVPENCANGHDDDCNGLIDCADPMCTMSPACCVATTEICTNGIDDDCDGAVDCLDSNCTAQPACITCPDQSLGSATGMHVASGTTSGADDLSASCGGMARGPETAFGWTAPRTATWIIDTIGSSFDTVLYVLDGDCHGAELACDDDMGGMFTSRVTVTVRGGQHVVIVVDGFNPGTGGNFFLNIAHVTSEAGACHDGVDNDADGFIDCVDTDCASDALCCTPRPEICDDGIDNDCDHATDCADPNCSAAPTCCMPIPEICDNFADDDCDGLIDCVDPSCTGRPPC